MARMPKATASFPPLTSLVSHRYAEAGRDRDKAHDLRTHATHFDETDKSRHLGFTLALLKRHRIPSAHLRLEITETSVMKNAKYALESIQKLRALGVMTVVDDFGTGYSSLAFLQRLPISGVKIERSFIAPLGESASPPQSSAALSHWPIRSASTPLPRESSRAADTIVVELCAAVWPGLFFSKPVGSTEVEQLLSKSYLAAS